MVRICANVDFRVQELSTIIRHGFAPTIILINNSGYTIEHVIHGPTQRYNDISQTWDYQNMLKFFGSTNSRSYTARTYEQLVAVLDDPEFTANKTMQLLEVFMDKFDFALDADEANKHRAGEVWQTAEGVGSGEWTGEARSGYQPIPVEICFA
jgi:TPP-dependent 2-oxoacid decarboxylase